MTIDPTYSNLIRQTFLAKFGDKKLISVLPHIEGEKIFVQCVGLIWTHVVGDREGKFVAKDGRVVIVKELAVRHPAQAKNARTAISRPSRRA